MLVVAEINDVVHDETMSSDIIFELDDNQDVDIDCDENGKIDDVPDNDYGMPYIISFQIYLLVDFVVHKHCTFPIKNG